MMMWNDRTWVSGAPGAAELAEAAAAGVRLVIELRDHGEPVRRGLTPGQLEHVAETLGLDHRQVPVVAERPCAGRIREVARLLDTAPGPVLVVCASGRRAAVVLSAIAGRRSGWQPAETLRRVAMLGFDVAGMPLLRDAMLHYVGGGAAADVQPAGAGLAI